jgi:hypothetical protein
MWIDARGRVLSPPNFYPFVCNWEFNANFALKTKCMVYESIGRYIRQRDKFDKKAENNNNIHKTES